MESEPVEDGLGPNRRDPRATAEAFRACVEFRRAEPWVLATLDSLVSPGRTDYWSDFAWVEERLVVMEAGPRVVDYPFERICQVVFFPEGRTGDVLTEADLAAAAIVTLSHDDSGRWFVMALGDVNKPFGPNGAFGPNDDHPHDGGPGRTQHRHEMGL